MVLIFVPLCYTKQAQQYEVFRTGKEIEKDWMLRHRRNNERTSGVAQPQNR